MDVAFKFISVISGRKSLSRKNVPGNECQSTTNGCSLRIRRMQSVKHGYWIFQFLRTQSLVVAIEWGTMGSTGSSYFEKINNFYEKLNISFY